MLEVINPTDGTRLDSFPEMERIEYNEIISGAHATFLEWRKTDFAHRAELMREAAKILSDNKEEYARLMTGEMGKLLTDARAEVEKCAWACLYYAEHAGRFLGDEFVSTDASKSYISYHPLGVILAVMPWNFPFWQVFRFAAPALMAGNAAVLKHASNVPGCARAIESIFRKAGFPENLFRALLVKSEEVEPIIANRLIRAVTLTGSGTAGRSVAGMAGKHLKKSVLELGGSDPYLILDDANIAQAAEICAKGRLLNNGQSCIGAKRFLVVREVYDEFLKHFYEKMKSARMGDPMHPDTDLGPLARFDLRDELHEQVQESIRKGAECILGGAIPEREGAFYPATILTSVSKDMPAYGEELFGPVASVIKVWDEEEAILIANDTVFGLGAAVFTEDPGRGERIARDKLEAGACFVNAMVKSDPRLPFGGIKESGYGRELSYLGIREFVNIKTVYIA